MKYCTQCGNKLSEGTKFCPKCGNPTSKNIVKKEVKKEGVNKEKLLLSIGTLLVIVASVIFAFANWNEMSSMFKVLFLVIESLLFLSLSLFSKRVNFKMPYKALWFIGITFIPIILNLVATDAMLGDYLSYKGSGIFVYLAISSFICAIIYLISDRVIKSNIFVYTTYFFIYAMVTSICGIFKLENYEYLLPILNTFNLIICIINIFIKNEKFNRTINRFISLVVAIFTILTFIYFETITTSNILVSIVFITVIVSQIILMFKSTRNIIIYLYPFLIFAILLSGVEIVLNSYHNIVLFISVLGIILINFIINLCSNRVIKNMAFILMLQYLLLLIGISDTTNLTLAIASTMTMIAFLFTIKLNYEQMQTGISKFLLPTNLLIIIYNTIRVFVKMDTSLILIIVSIICFTVFTIVQNKSKDKFTKSVFESFSYAFLIFSGLYILSDKPTIVAFILNEMVWLYYFVFSKATKRNKAVSICLLIAVILNFILCSIRYSITFHYSLIFISIITAILDYVEYKFNNKKAIYIYISIVATSLATLLDFSNLAIFGLGLIVLTFVSTYYMLVKIHKPEFAIKFLYTLIGFVLIDSVFNYFIDITELSYLFILISYIIIIISMYLLEVDSDRKVLAYTGIIIYPYLKLIYNVDFLMNYTTPLVVFLTILVTLIYFERVIKMDETLKIIFELIIFGIVHLFTISDMLIFDFILSAFYIFYGFYKKRDAYVLFGTILLIATLTINIFKIFNNITVTYVLLIIGLGMLGYVFYLEAKKNNKK